MLGLQAQAPVGSEAMQTLWARRWQEDQGDCLARGIWCNSMLTLGQCRAPLSLSKGIDDHENIWTCMSFLPRSTYSLYLLAVNKAMKRTCVTHFNAIALLLPLPDLYYTVFTSLWCPDWKSTLHAIEPTVTLSALQYQLPPRPVPCLINWVFALSRK
jgi:hypothetical protein